MRMSVIMIEVATKSSLRVISMVKMQLRLGSNVSRRDGIDERQGLRRRG
jgi:hypothetical protein